VAAATKLSMREMILTIVRLARRGWMNEIRRTNREERSEYVYTFPGDFQGLL
jgi:hypothetical protein